MLCRDQYVGICEQNTTDGLVGDLLRVIDDPVHENRPPRAFRLFLMTSPITSFLERTVPTGVANVKASEHLRIMIILIMASSPVTPLLHTGLNDCICLIVSLEPAWLIQQHHP
jgi:hypothetical protein